jgi:hypothetical protein
MPSLADILKRLDAQDFGPKDSTLLSAINNPLKGGKKLADWLTKNVNTAAGIPDQYDNPNPLLAPKGQEQAAFDIAGMAQLGSMPFAPKSAGGTLGTFIGPKAATWDADAAAAASKLLDDGADPAQVWKEHLIGRMPDKTLFSEIDDSGARYVDNYLGGASPGYADQLYQHPTLFNEYPELKNIALQHQAGSGGSFDFSNRKMTIGMDDADNVAPHEFQHAIQQREGWAMGGSPDEFKQEINYTADSTPSLYELLNLIESKTGNSIDFSPSMLNDVSDTSVFLDELINGLDRQTVDSFLTKQDVRNFKKQGYDFGRDTELGTVLEVLSSNARSEIDSIKAGDSPLKQYLNLTGEAQARATQDRLNMDMQQRRENYPLAGGKLSDIPLEQLIYRYGDNGPSMSVELPETEFSKAHKIAQQNAVDMLGLPPDNTAMDRARAMGFDTETPLYHGTGGDIKEFDNSKYGQNFTGDYGVGHYLTQNAKSASKYADLPDSGNNVIPLFANYDNPAIVKAAYADGDLWNMVPDARTKEELTDGLKKLGHGSVFVDGGRMGVKYGNEINIFDPKNIRSRFAAFDPLRKDSSNLLASYLLPATMLGYGMYNQDKKSPLADLLRAQ